MRTNAISLLSSPYERIVPHSRTTPDLGSALIWSPGVDVLETDIVLAQQTCPWCEVLICLDGPRATEAILEAARKLHGPLYYFDAEGGLTASNLTQQMRKAKSPSLVDMAEYLAWRTGHPSAIFYHLLSSSRLQPSSLISYRTLCRYSDAVGCFRPHDWLLIAQLIKLASLRDASVEELARLYGFEARTLRLHIRRSFNCTVSQFRERVGWRWLLEATLRSSAKPLPPPLA